MPLEGAEKLPGVFPPCSSLAPGRRTTPGSCRLPSPVPTLLPDGPAGSLSPTPGGHGIQILLLDESLLLSSFLSKLYLLPVHTRVPVGTNRPVCPYKHFDLHQSSTALQGRNPATSVNTSNSACVRCALISASSV